MSKYIPGVFIMATGVRFGKNQFTPDRPKNWLEWNLEPCQCRHCKETRISGGNTEKIPCPGGCKCVTFKPKECYSCGLPLVHHPVHHHSEFCRAEREALRQANGFYKNVFTPEPGKMYVKIKPYAANGVTGGGRASYDYRKAMFHIEGLWVEVETEHLFTDQYNLVPTPHTDNGLRLMDAQVADIIGDIRPDFKKCGWCGNKEQNEAYVCTKCGKDDHFRSLTIRRRKR